MILQQLAPLLSPWGIRVECIGPGGRAPCPAAQPPPPRGWGSRRRCSPGSWRATGSTPWCSTPRRLDTLRGGRTFGCASGLPGSRNRYLGKGPLAAGRQVGARRPCRSERWRRRPSDRGSDRRKCLAEVWRCISGYNRKCSGRDPPPSSVFSAGTGRVSC